MRGAPYNVKWIQPVVAIVISFAVVKSHAAVVADSRDSIVGVWQSIKRYEQNYHLVYRQNGTGSFFNDKVPRMSEDFSEIPFTWSVKAHTLTFQFELSALSPSGRRSISDFEKSLLLDSEEAKNLGQRMSSTTKRIHVKASWSITPKNELKLLFPMAAAPGILRKERWTYEQLKSDYQTRLRSWAAALIDARKKHDAWVEETTQPAFPDGARPIFWSSGQSGMFILGMEYRGRLSPATFITKQNIGQEVTLVNVQGVLSSTRITGNASGLIGKVATDPPTNSNQESVGLAASWKLVPRPIQSLGHGTSTHRLWCSEFLRRQGIRSDTFKISEAYSSDLDGDGTPEDIVVLEATKSTRGEKGDFGFVLVRGSGSTALPPTKVCGYYDANGDPDGDNHSVFHIVSMADLFHSNTMQLVISQVGEGAVITVATVSSKGVRTDLTKAFNP